MFPLVDRDGRSKPLIQILVEEAVEAGVEEVCIVTAAGQEKVYREYFGPLDDETLRALRGKDWAILESEKLAGLGERLRFVEQALPEGFGHAVYQARGFVGDEPFLLMLGDHVYVSDTKDRCARQIISAFEEFNPEAMTAVAPTLERQLHLFGVVRGRAMEADRGIYVAEKIVEKPGVDEARKYLATPGLPMGTYLGHFGMHIFSPRIFDSLEYLIKSDLRQDGEIQLTAAQEHLRAQTDRYWAVVVHGQRYDTGIPFGLVEAQMALALGGVHRAEFCEAMVRIMGLQGRS
jgi:UTP--glucose-1-phosphate uridylyltransferase